MVRTAKRRVSLAPGTRRSKSAGTGAVERVRRRGTGHGNSGSMPVHQLPQGIPIARAFGRGRHRHPPTFHGPHNERSASSPPVPLEGDDVVPRDPTGTDRGPPMDANLIDRGHPRHRPRRKGKQQRPHSNKNPTDTGPPGVGNAIDAQGEQQPWRPDGDHPVEERRPQDQRWWVQEPAPPSRSARGSAHTTDSVPEAGVGDTRAATSTSRSPAASG